MGIIVSDIVLTGPSDFAAALARKLKENDFAFLRKKYTQTHHDAPFNVKIEAPSSHVLRITTVHMTRYDHGGIIVSEIVVQIKQIIARMGLNIEFKVKTKVVTNSSLPRYRPTPNLIQSRDALSKAYKHMETATDNMLIESEKFDQAGKFQQRAHAKATASRAALNSHTSGRGETSHSRLAKVAAARRNQEDMSLAENASSQTIKQLNVVKKAIRQSELALNMVKNHFHLVSQSEQDHNVQHDFADEIKYMNNHAHA